MIIGVTGGSGSGKSTLSRVLEENGFLFLDCDEIYHHLLKTDTAMLRSIEDRFPGTVEDGILNRKALGAIVFQHESALLALNAITHAAVKEEVQRQLDVHPGSAVIDAIGLFEGNLAELCDLTVAVVAPAEDRVKRLMQRDGITESYARSRIAAQHEDSWFRKKCDFVLENDGDSHLFRAKCLAFLAGTDIMKENPQKKGE